MVFFPTKTNFGKESRFQLGQLMCVCVGCFVMVSALCSNVRGLNWWPQGVYFAPLTGLASMAVVTGSSASITLVLYFVRTKIRFTRFHALLVQESLEIEQCEVSHWLEDHLSCSKARVVQFLFCWNESYCVFRKGL